MPRKINADIALEEIRRRRKIARRKAGLQSKLNRKRSSLVELRRAGANHRLSADHTTVMRYMKSLPEMAADVSLSSTTSPE